MTKSVSPSMDLKEHKQFWEDRGDETLEPMSFVSLVTFEQGRSDMGKTPH